MFLSYVIPQATPEDKVVAEELFRKVAEDKKRGYTQSEAQLSLEKIQRKVKELSGLAKNEQIIDEALKREREYNKEYYVFYSSIPYLRLFQDITRKLYKREAGKVGALKDKAFQFIRYNYKDSTYDKYANVKDFLEKEVRENGMVDDNEARLRTILVSSNVAFFGNIGIPGEFTYSYFKDPQAWAALNPAWLEAAIKSFGYSVEFVPELMELAKETVTDAGDLFQIFIPKQKANDVGYLCWRVGIPFDQPFIEYLTGKKDLGMYYASYEKLKQTLAEFRKKWLEKDPETAQWVNTILDNIKQGKYYLYPFLDKYKSKPYELPELNFYQARLLITNDVLLNPNSGLRIYRYSTLDPIREAMYKEKLSNIIQRMELEKHQRLGTIQSEKANKLKEQLLAIKTRIKALFSRRTKMPRKLRRQQLQKIKKEQEELIRKMQEEGIPVDEFILTPPPQEQPKVTVPIPAAAA